MQSGLSFSTVWSTPINTKLMKKKVPRKFIIQYTGVFEMPFMMTKHPIPIRANGSSLALMETAAKQHAFRIFRSSS